jgi:hypothetical protein
MTVQVLFTSENDETDYSLHALVATYDLDLDTII